MSFNEKRSYTEYNVTTSTSVFAIGFDDYNMASKDRIIVTIDGVEATEAGYTVTRSSPSTLTLNPAVVSGVVRLTRETNIDQTFNKFTAGSLFTPKNVNDNFEQILRSQQEVEDRQTKLEGDVLPLVDGLEDALAAAESASQAAEEAANAATEAAASAEFFGSNYGKGIRPLWQDALKPYAKWAEVRLNNGNIVRSVVPDNMNDPNSDTDGWVLATNLETVSVKNELSNVLPHLNKLAYVLSEASLYAWNGSEWLFKEKLITPDMFISEVVDDLLGFNLACVFANQNNLPVTLLPRTYNIAGQINLSSAGYGLQSLSNSLFSQTVLKASANPDNLDVFCLFGNVDRRKLAMLCIDANGLFDTALDTTYSLQVGPSLNLTFQNIIVRGYRKIGWVSENNSDTYFDKCCIFEPKNAVSTGLISMKCITIGGPAQFTNCNFLNGKLQVSAQHIETNQCVIRGIEFMGGSWNVYNAIGTHHFPDETTNSLFIFTGEVWGFSVIGGLCEANNGGYVLNGNGGNLVTSKLSFIQTRMSPDVGALNLQTGSINATFGATVVSIDGGFCGLSSINPSGFVDEVELLNVNYNGLTITKKYTVDLDGATKVDTPTLEQVYFSKALPKNLKSTKYEEYKNGAGGYYGIVNFLSGKAASGSLEIMDASGVHYAKFDYTAIYNLSGVLLKTLTSRVNVTGGSQLINAYIDAGEIQLILTNESNSPNPNPLLVKFSGIIVD